MRRFSVCGWLLVPVLAGCAAPATAPDATPAPAVARTPTDVDSPEGRIVEQRLARLERDAAWIINSERVRPQRFARDVGFAARYFENQFDDFGTMIDGTQRWFERDAERVEKFPGYFEHAAQMLWGSPQNIPRNAVRLTF